MFERCTFFREHGSCSWVPFLEFSLIGEQLQPVKLLPPLNLLYIEFVPTTDDVFRSALLPFHQILQLLPEAEVALQWAPWFVANYTETHRIYLQITGIINTGSNTEFITGLNQIEITNIKDAGPVAYASVHLVLHPSYATISFESSSPSTVQHFIAHSRPNTLVLTCVLLMFCLRNKSEN